MIEEPPIPIGDTTHVEHRGDWEIVETPFGEGVYCYVKGLAWEGQWERYELGTTYVRASGEELVAADYQPDSRVFFDCPRLWMLTTDKRAVAEDGPGMDAVARHAPSHIRTAFARLRWRLGWVS